MNSIWEIIIGNYRIGRTMDGDMFIEVQKGPNAGERMSLNRATEIKLERLIERFFAEEF